MTSALGVSVPDTLGVGSGEDGPLLLLDAGGDGDGPVSELPAILTRSVRGCGSERTERTKRDEKRSSKERMTRSTEKRKTELSVQHRNQEHQDECLLAVTCPGRRTWPTNYWSYVIRLMASLRAPGQAANSDPTHTADGDDDDDSC